MYHSVSTERERTAPYYWTVTEPAIFAAHMEFLAKNGCSGVTLSEGLKLLQSSASVNGGARPVAITFDDGLSDFCSTAVPILRRHGFRATMYLPTGFIADKRRRFNNRECLTWGEIADLHATGFEFGSHTVSHPTLVNLDWPEIRAELRESKAAIEARLQSPVTAFAYPYAFPQHRTSFVERFTDLLMQTGYLTCVTTMIGRVRARDGLLSLKRLPINSGDDEKLFCAKLDGRYDWLATAQTIFKRLKPVLVARGS